MITVLGGVLASLTAQPQRESSVGYTEARSYRISQKIRLPGTVQTRLVSTVASEVSGLVIEFPVRQGQTVQEGEVLARLRRENLELRLREARAQLSEDDARLQLAERTMQRTKELLEKGAVSQQDVDDRESEFNSLERRADRLRAIIEQLEDDLERTVIRAPFSGIVVQEHTQLAEWIDVGGEVLELMSLDELEVVIDLPERYYASVRPGDRASASFDALPGVKVTGVIRAVIPQADAQSRTFPVLMEIPNLDGKIGVGMVAQVELSFGKSRTTTIVPKDAIVVQDRGQSAYVLDEEDHVWTKDVVSGTAVGAWVEVKGEIQPGQRVVTRGNERLRDGQKVRVNPTEVQYEAP
jgi:RND family efflux transporter MFP subunit